MIMSTEIHNALLKSVQGLIDETLAGNQCHVTLILTKPKGDGFEMQTASTENEEMLAVAIVELAKEIIKVNSSVVTTKATVH